MKNLKILGLTFLLVLGFTFPSCDRSGYNCNCPDPTYFNVEGLDILFYQDANLGLPIEALDTIPFNTGKYVHLDYLVSYHTLVEPKRDWSFSLINSAYACSCAIGSYESKTEKLVDFSITTLNNFDDDHLANSNINDLFEYNGYFIEDEFGNYNNNPLTEHIANQTDEILEGEDMVLKLTKAPELDEEFKIKIRMELSTGEIYEVESDAVFITP